MKKSYRGWGFYISLIVVVVLVWFLLEGQHLNQDDYNYAQFKQELADDEIKSVEVQPNRVYPTGRLDIVKTDKSEETLYVLDVSEAQSLMDKEKFTSYVVNDIPAENWLMNLLPLLLVFGAMFILFMIVMNNQAAGGGGGSKMMNFGKSRAKMTTDENRNVTFENVAGLREEKEELEEIVDFLKEPRKYTRLGARIPKGVLLVGPPGTGKTSRALRRMVEHFYATSSMQILLLAYTNRAVDEICQSLSSITSGIDYIRVGSELSCDVRFRGHLLENILAECNSRREVNTRMTDCRVYVGTVASIAAKAELFKLKRFDVAIVDEATQILEPQLLGILCAKFADERNAVGKFILIGDHKQLPAVILQNSGHSEVHDEGLRKVGLFNLKDSLFERLYRFHLKEESPKAIDMLCRQGRMHPGVAFFPNKAFYAGRLEALGLPHQLEHIEAPVRFIPSEQDLESISGKTNQYEARIVAGLAREVYLAYEEEFDPNRTLGVITPYRSQIALIRKELQTLAIPALSRISIDTVERYQGSERDVIIYSFCVNHLYQLRFLPNLTEEDGVQIDRKLNVALTRARKQLFITGVPEILNHNSIYQHLLKTIY